MSMQGTHIFRRGRTTQLIRCIPWTTKLCLHPTIVKKMKTFLEVENKMGPIIPAPVSQFRPLLPETNPNVRKGYTQENIQANHPQNYHNVPSLTTSPTKTYTHIYATPYP